MQVAEIKEQGLAAVAVVQEKSRISKGWVKCFYAPGKSHLFAGLKKIEESVNRSIRLAKIGPFVNE